MALYVGLISGTSMDGIDAALLDIDDESTALREFFESPYPDLLRARLEKVVRARVAAIDEIGALDTAIGQTFADAALALLKRARVDAAQVSAIGSHGQTIGHRIDDLAPYTLQIGNPHVIAWRTGIRTVAGFRAMDVAAGGQGAPLVPGFHQQVFRRPDYDVAVVNIGGISNVSLLYQDPQRALIGFDCGPGNTLMDLWIQRHRDLPYDADGQWAAAGVADPGLLTLLHSDPYFAQTAPKSTGREHFHLAWLDRQLAQGGSSLAPVHVQATLAHLTAQIIAEAVGALMPDCRELIVCGGGARNATLMQLLGEKMGRDCSVCTTDERGWPAGAVEASTFAWLARRRLVGLPGNEPTVTGACDRVLLGAVYETG